MHGAFRSLHASRTSPGVTLALSQVKLKLIQHAGTNEQLLVWRYARHPAGKTTSRVAACRKLLGQGSNKLTDSLTRLTYSPLPSTGISTTALALQLMRASYGKMIHHEQLAKESPKIQCLSSQVTGPNKRQMRLSAELRVSGYDSSMRCRPRSWASTTPAALQQSRATVVRVHPKAVNPSINEFSRASLAVSLTAKAFRSFAIIGTYDP